jgi:signal transduction histidine kinase
VSEADAPPGTSPFEADPSKQAALGDAAEQERKRILDQLLTDASHDLRTPLTSVTSSAYLLQKLFDKLLGFSSLSLAASTPDLEKQLIHQIQGVLTSHQHAVTRLRHVIEAMLEMVRLNNTLNFTLKLNDLNATVRSAIDGEWQRAEAKGLSFTVALDGTLPHLFIEPSEFSAAIRKLVENAVSFTPPGGSITVSTFRRGMHAIVEVRDTGIGISAVDLPHIFDSFYRADKARSVDIPNLHRVAGSGSGGGFGLAMARRIVEMHGGQIEADSVQGTGSSFRLVMPLRPRTPTAGC